MKNIENTPRGELGRVCMGPGVSVKGCTVTGCMLDDQCTSSTLCVCVCVCVILYPKCYMYTFVYLSIARATELGTGEDGPGEDCLREDGSGEDGPGYCSGEVPSSTL